MRAALVHPQLLRSGVWGRSVLGRSEEIEQCADEPLPPGMTPPGYRRLSPVCGLNTGHIPNLSTSAGPQLAVHDCCDPPLSSSPRSAKPLANTSHALAPTSFAALGGAVPDDLAMTAAAQGGRSFPLATLWADPGPIQSMAVDEDIAPG
jgi:hypothetical protein